VACTDDGAVECEYALAEEEVVEGEGRFGVSGEAGGSLCWRGFCGVQTNRKAGADDLVGTEHTEWWVG